MPNKPIRISNVVKASHLLLTGYAHWLPNDLRGSGSTEIQKLGLEQLGPIHFGRKRIQPPRSELKAFHRAAEPKLAHEVIWFDEQMRDAIAVAIERTILEFGYTVWACAVMRNHLHLVIRTHRDNSLTMLTRIANATFEELHRIQLVPENHPVWSERPYKVFLKTLKDVHGRIEYVELNPIKEGLPEQKWPFVKECELY